MADYDDALSSGLSALAAFFVDEDTLGHVLARVAQLSCEVSSADLAGITLLVEGKPRTGVCTDPEAAEIDEAQYDSGIGPCLDAFRQQAVFHIPSTEDDTVWASFSRTAFEHGIVTTLSLPLGARGEALGAMNLYAKTPGVFDDEGVRHHALVFAQQASIVLANAQLYWDALQLNENLHQALHSRSHIDHAVGIIMASGGQAPDEAFQVLVKASQRENRKLREIADEVVRNAMARRASSDPV